MRIILGESVWGGLMSVDSFVARMYILGNIQWAIQWAVQMLGRNTQMNWLGTWTVLMLGFETCCVGCKREGQRRRRRTMQQRLKEGVHEELYFKGNWKGDGCIVHTLTWIEPERCGAEPLFRSQVRS
jgi:hypothetical protein